ncbi:CVNH domain-containing protein [Chondromyces crocatus]|uniref:Cyanovirin-N domain-containing protein n=1 Tax=Chondromyces crocatus TaxID=52 RepID=A0A0K1EN03_CHOCO|nr:CVNH domain-containing protein [Chondromyces crocatus]AKT42229.1 uncharacterized protein CMC5_064520 [Chondromyces crocatus]
MADALSPGSCTQTSRDLSFEQVNGSRSLSARRARREGSFSDSALTYYVASRDGVLIPLPGSSYVRMARNIHLEDGEDGVSLLAEGQRPDGSWEPGDFEFQDLVREDIANHDGRRKYGG